MAQVVGSSRYQMRGTGRSRRNHAWHRTDHEPTKFGPCTGRLILRFDDTNPVKEKSEFEENILADLERLGICPDVVEYTSDYFEVLLETATTWLKEGKAYVDKTPVEEMRAQRMNFEENEYRSASVAQNLRLWEEMKKGSEEGLQVRFDGI